MTRSQHLSVVIGLFGLWHGLRYLCSVVEYVGAISSSVNLWFAAAVFVIEPILLTAVVVGRHRWAKLLLRAEAAKPVQQSRALVLGGSILMGADLVERGFWQIWNTADYKGLENATALSAPAVLCGAVLVLFARPLATVLTGQR